MKIFPGLAVVLALSACSKDSASTDEWRQFQLSGDRLSFEMPGFADIAQSVTGDGHDLLREEKAITEYDSRVYDLRVLSGPGLTKEPDQSPAVWAKFFLVDWISANDDHTIEGEGEWNHGSLKGYWTKLALPPAPPGTPGGRTVPVYIWLHAAFWEGKSILAQFVATQASCTNDVYTGAVDRARKRFLASIAVE